MTKRKKRLERRRRKQGVKKISRRFDFMDSNCAIAGFLAEDEKTSDAFFRATNDETVKVSMTPICVGETMRNLKIKSSNEIVSKETIRTFSNFIIENKIRIEKTNDSDIKLANELKEHAHYAHFPELVSLACAIRKKAHVFRTEDSGLLDDKLRIKAKKKYSIKIEPLVKRKQLQFPNFLSS